MNSENIFDIWRFIGKSTPFIVRRNGWYHLSYMVTRVVPKRQYGDAYGYKLIDGKPENGNTNEDLIDCCGCGNWELIENLVEVASNLKWSCLDDNYNLTFGKYKGTHIEEVVEKDKEYAEWAFSHVGGLFDKLFCKQQNIQIQKLYDLKKDIKAALKISSDDWIKSPVPLNFDTVLDHHKYACALGESTIEEAAKDIEDYYYSCLKPEIDIKKK